MLKYVLAFDHKIYRSRWGARLRGNAISRLTDPVMFGWHQVMRSLAHLALICLVLSSVASTSFGEIRAGAAERNITPPVGTEIQHFFRTSVGVHEPLFARCLYLEDSQGSQLAIVSLDLILGGFEACDQLRETIRKQTGIQNTLLAFSHTHASLVLGPRGKTKVRTDTGSKWNDKTLDAILGIIQNAMKVAQPVKLRVGRSAVQVGFNRRLLNERTGSVFMGPNRQGSVVPWVNVLIADSQKTGKPIAVLFQHTAHPVIVPHKSKMISADFPGAAVNRIRENLGSDVIAMFGQGCAGNINGFPLRSTHQQADAAGHKLGDAVLKAIKTSTPIKSKTFQVRHVKADLPSRALPSKESWKEMVAHNKKNTRRMKQLHLINALMVLGKQPPARRFDACAVMFEGEWCLITMPHEMFSQYELWIDENAPFERTMTFAYTNGYQGYVATDEALKLGPRGGYEAGSLPNWSGQVWTPHFGPPAVGVEKIIKDAVSTLWSQAENTEADRRR
jgi:neutral ceramidase